MKILIILGNILFWCLAYALEKWEHKDETPEERWDRFMKTGW